MKRLGLFVGMSLVASIHAAANPTGGVVAAGSATIAPVGALTLKINQTSPTAIINWQTFSVARGQLTEFIQPNSSAAVLNRVLGGGASQIDGTLSATGQLFLINGNGVYVSRTGRVNTAGFTASTLDISDADFLAGNLHFIGTSTASVQNFGAINAGTGNIYFIAQQVSNGGTLKAPKGTVGLAAGRDVIVAQQNADGSTVTVSPSSAAAPVNGTGVSNAGIIAAAAAELRAANGNIYSLAINNTGTVRATGVSNTNGHIWLVADSGTVTTKGTLATSAAGSIVTNGEAVGASGTVNSGQGGRWTIDPSDVVISNAQNSATNLNAVTLGKDLSAGSSVTIQAFGGNTDTGNIDVESPVTWTSIASLTLMAPDNININATITGTKGGLLLDGTLNSRDTATAGVSVSSFVIDRGIWSQIVGPGGLTKLPAFSATKVFSMEDSAVFARFAGGDGSEGNPYQVADVYGLQGIAYGNTSRAPFSDLQEDNYILKSAINATSLAWHFSPIPDFTGDFNGNNLSITGLSVVVTSTHPGGLFGKLEGSVENLSLVNESVQGQQSFGLLAGQGTGAITNCKVSGTLTVLPDLGDAVEDIGGLVGENTGAITHSTSNVTMTVPANTLSYDTEDIGGLVGDNAGQVVSSSSSGKVTITGSNPANGTFLLLGIGGFAGENFGTISSCTNSAAVNVSVGNAVYIGGLAGYNANAILSSSNAGAVSFIDGTDAGGVAGYNANVLDASSNSGAITGTSANGDNTNIGGVVGEDSGAAPLTGCANTGAVTVSGPNVADVGGLAGAMRGYGFSNSHNSGVITLSGTSQDAGGIAGLLDPNSEGIGLVSCQNTGAIKITGQCLDVGGIAGEVEGSTSVAFCTSNAAITTGVAGSGIGGLVGGVDEGVIESCSAAGSLNLGLDSSSVGGLAGAVARGLGFNSVSDSTSSVTITITATANYGLVDAGGLVGNSAGAIEHCTSTGAITLKGTATATGDTVQNVGGIAGTNTGTITNSTHSGAITLPSPGAMSVGGVAGVNGNYNGDSSGGQITGSSNSGAISVTGSPASGTGAFDVGGVVGTNYSPVVTSLQSLSNTGAVTVGNAAEDVGGVLGDEVQGGVMFASNTGAVKAGTGAANIGGVAGFVGGLDTTTSVEVAVNTGAVTVGSNSQNIGGAAGQTGGFLLSDDYNTGAITAGGTGGAQSVGGVVGNVTSAGRVQLSYNTGNVTVTGASITDVGGLAGYNGATTADGITSTYSTGKVTAKGGTNVGGLIGLSTTAGSVSDSYWNVQSSGQASSFFGFPVNTTAQMEQQSTYADWDFTNNWGINPNGTPYLLSFTSPHNTKP